MSFVRVSYKGITLGFQPNDGGSIPLTRSNQVNRTIFTAFYKGIIMSFTQEESNEVEICVSCGAPTSYKKSDDVTFRYGYIEGAGQLCFKCSQTRKMHKTGSYE